VARQPPLRRVDLATLTCALGPDSAGILLSEMCADVQRRLDVAVYEVGPAYARLLGEAAARGAAVRLLVDAHGGANSGALSELAGSPVHRRVLAHAGGAEAHWKVIVADERLAIGTGNLIWRDAPRNPLPPSAARFPGTREWWVIVAGASPLATQAEALVEAAWTEAGPLPARPWVEPAGRVEVPRVGLPRPLVPPCRVDVPATALRLDCGGGAIADLFTDAIDAAEGRVLCTVPYVHAATAPVIRLLDRLEARVRSGLDVRLLLGAVPEEGDVERLRRRRLDVRVMDPLRCTTGHAKGMVADEVAVVASANWSAAGLGHNREAALRIADPTVAGYFADALERDWSTARPLSHRAGGRHQA
jgi:phosphatidylserine/phosphatidylglycerophosphate/cardiolipin synthase-like enzyme